jgi:uncharacterized protein YcnI
MTFSRIATLGAGAFLTLSAPALAHVTFETPQATANSTYKAVLMIPHGCDGQPTLKVRVQIPEGVIAVKPMPKPGWALEITKGAYTKTYQLYGDPVSEGVKEIVWSGSLADDNYDEFIFQARITDAVTPGATVSFPVVQECANAKEAWTEIPAEGQDPHSLKMPAPGLKILAAASSTPVAVKTGALVIEQAWSRATPPGAKVGGGYLRITNTGKEADRLTGGSFPGASRIEVHEMSMTDNVMRMKPVEGGLEIPPGATVELKPGGFHLMFMDLGTALKDGQIVKGILTFEKAGSAAVEFTVRPMGADGAAPSGHQHH